MKLLHTSDWHVGKPIRGNSRHREHQAVLEEIVALAAAEAVDIVVVAGDLFDTGAPSPEAEALVYRTLLGLADTGATVAVIAGNHDNPRRLQAVAPLLELGRVRLVTEPTRPDDGGVQLLAGPSGEEARVAFLPFVSRRGIVRSDDLMAGAAYEHAAAYADRLRQLLDVLSTGFSADVPNVVVAHAFVLGGATGGGERAAHLVDEYAVPAVSFSPAATYVALGHLHRAQQIAGPAPLHYCGSPLALDFGDTTDAKQVNLVTLGAGIPAAVTSVPLRAGHRLHTLRGSLDEVAAAAAALGDEHWLRLVLTDASRAGLADDARQRIGDHVVDVTVAAPAHERTPTASRKGRSPHELFAEYCRHVGTEDPRVLALFADLYDEATG